METLQFYTTGDGFTSLVRNFISEGEFDKAYEILLSGGMNAKQISNFFKFKYKFEGDTRVGDHTLSLVACKSDIDIADMLMTAVRTRLSADKHTFYDLRDLSERCEKNMNALYKAIPKSKLIKLLLPNILKAEGFRISNVENNDKDGAILRDGTFVACGFQEHKDLWPLLYCLDLSEAKDWMDDHSLIHVSSGQLNGKIAHSIEKTFRDKELITPEQIDALFKYRNSIESVYGFGEGTITYTLSQYVNRTEDHGGKFNNLSFLKRFYKNVRLPQFNKQPQMIDIKYKTCIRTSPKYSLPGLLNSKFDVKFGEYESTLDAIKSDYDKYKGLKSGNELHVFYQQQLDGLNGVCHCRGRAGDFTYALSSNRGDVVQGKEGDKVLDVKIEAELRGIARELWKDLEKSIQLEFVVSGDELYIVQLRALGNEYDETVIVQPPSKDVIGYGLTFSRGNEEIDVKDILIVDSDSDSSSLIGKKALIVRNKVEFSHVLALSKSLGIPSMYDMKAIVLPKSGKVKFVSYNKEGWISKI